MSSYARLLKVKNRAEKWKKRAKALEQELEQWKRAVDRGNAEVQARQNTINQLTVTNKFLEGKTKHQEGRIKDLENKVKTLSVPLVHKKGFEDLLAEYEQLEQANSKLEQELEEKLHDIGEMGKTIASQTDLLLMAQKQIRDLQDILADKDEETKDVVDREHRIHNEAARQMIDRIKELEFQVAELHRLADDRLSANNRLRDRINELDADVTNLEYRNQFLEQQVKAKDTLLEGRGMWAQTGPNAFKPAPED